MLGVQRGHHPPPHPSESGDEANSPEEKLYTCSSNWENKCLKIKFKHLRIESGQL